MRPCVTARWAQANQDSRSDQWYESSKQMPQSRPAGSGEFSHSYNSQAIGVANHDAALMSERRGNSSNYKYAAMDVESVEPAGLYPEPPTNSSERLTGNPLAIFKPVHDANASLRSSASGIALADGFSDSGEGRDQIGESSQVDWSHLSDRDPQRISTQKPSALGGGRPSSPFIRGLHLDRPDSASPESVTEAAMELLKALEKVMDSAQSRTRQTESGKSNGPYSRQG